MNDEEYKKTLTGNYRYKFCKTCKHTSRDHSRGRKINGVWTGKCSVPDCECKFWTENYKDDKFYES